MIRNISTLLLVVGFSFIASYYYPHLTISPGSVKEYHKKFENDCGKCHVPFKGVGNENCLSCHDAGDSIIKGDPNRDTKSEIKSPANVSVVNLHKVIKDTSCFRCHPEHEAKHATLRTGSFHAKSKVGDSCQNCHIKPAGNTHANDLPCETCHNTKTWRQAIFKHTGFQKDCITCHKKPENKTHEATGTDCTKCHNTSNWKQTVYRHKENQKDCAACHKKPENSFHEKSGSNCAKCHNTTNWKQAEFRHEENQKDCSSCHQKPADSFHDMSGSDCAKCHNTTNWKSANFDHSRLFRLTGHHRARCQTCHNEENYKTYTCYGCHKHSEAGVNRKHVRLGLKSFDKCTDCHRSGSESQAWQNLKKLQGNAFDSTTSASSKKRKSVKDGEYRENRGKEHDEEHEHKKRKSREHEEHDDD